MHFAVAGIILLISFIIGTVSCLAVPYCERNENESEVEATPRIKRRVPPVTAYAAFFSKKNWRQWSLVGAVAILCATALALSYYNGVSVLDLCRQAGVAWMLLSAMLIDQKTHQIPNQIVFSAIGAGAILLLLEFILNRTEFFSTLVMSVIGLLFCIVIFYILSRITKEGLGMGDVKLISAMGWMLGIASTLVTVLFALILCAAISVLLLLRKKKGKKDRIPFGPFVFYGYILMLLLFSL